VEAKDNHHTVGHGMQQALGYAEILEVPSAFSSNGDAFAFHNKVPAAGEDIEAQFPLEKFPPPQILWQRHKSYRGIEEEPEEPKTHICGHVFEIGARFGHEKRIPECVKIFVNQTEDRFDCRGMIIPKPERIL
jgi:type I site-specific restriction endonuclease